ncbi:MAG TPA: hypothetical protein DCE78_10815 [Bacteroidetes bacterium]|nr:hypothetical protein [Bacteroidota bacterium]
MIRIHKHGHHGILLPDFDLGLDISGASAKHIFISHAHADHVPSNRNLSVYATPATAALMRVRGFKGEITQLPFHQTISLGDSNVTFFPAGHILGSAMTYIETPQGSVLYTGDYRYPASPASEGFFCPEKVDYFITEATFSLPLYRWKSQETLFDQIRDFVRESKQFNQVPVFLTYTLGKAQEVMMALEPLKIPLQVHDGAYGLCKVYEEFGLNIGVYSKINLDTVNNSIVIIPMSYLSSATMLEIPNIRTAYCSGWSDLESRKSYSSVDKHLSISDHIDFFELIDLCKRLNPKHVFITHTPNPEVVSHYLSNLGIASSPLDSTGFDD